MSAVVEDVCPDGAGAEPEEETLDGDGEGRCEVRLDAGADGGDDESDEDATAEDADAEAGGAEEALAELFGDDVGAVALEAAECDGGALADVEEPPLGST